MRQQLYQSKGRCGICGRFVPCDNFTVDHIIPISRGGTYDMDNLQAACYECNQMKYNFLPDDMLDRIAEILRYQALGKGDERAAKMIRKMDKEVRKSRKAHMAW